MSGDPAPAPAPRLPRSNPLSLLAAGQRALSEVPGLRLYLLKGFALLYGLTALAGLVGVGLVYYFAIQPLTAGLEGWVGGEGFWGGLLSWVLGVIVWLLQLAMLGATVVLSLLVAVSLMSLWFEGLVARIVAHHRGTAGDAAPFSLTAWAASIGRALTDAAWLLILAVAALVLGFVPVIGVVLVIVIEGYLLGREVRDPYLEARAALGDDPRALRRGLGAWTVFAGLLPFALALVPVLGWVLLPAAIVYLVAGFAWRGEQARGAE